MTENQYKVVQDNLGEYSVLRPDNSIVCTELQYKATAELFCDELNELNNENKQLKQKIGNLEHTRDFCADVCADCKRLEEETGQLKKEVESKQRVINAYEQYINDLKEDGVLDD